MSVETRHVLGGRYALGVKLGKGGAGEVWSAIDRTDQREVALKFLQLTIADDPEARARFVREGLALSRIDSPFVCRVLDVAAGEGRAAYLVLERIHGEPLDVLLKGSRTLAIGEVHALVDDLWSGVAAAHAAGIVHRDIKPSNIVVAGEARRTPKLIDFGLAKLLAAGDATLTTGGAALGTPHYMAPEQFVDAAGADERSDIYSLATVAFRMLAGTIPFRGQGHEVLALKRSHRAATLAEVTGRPWPAPLERFFEHTLARDRADRPRTAGEAQTVWRAACHGVEGAVTAGAGDADVDELAPTPMMPRRR